MNKVGIVIDDWKLPIFERHLSASSYSWTTIPGITENTLSLIVMSNSILELEKVVRAANTEAANTTRRKL